MKNLLLAAVLLIPSLAHAQDAAQLDQQAPSSVA
jgi:hypothetical protein